MASRGISERLGTLLATAGRVHRETESEAVVFLSEADLDWEDVRERLGRAKLIVVTAGDESPRPASEEPDQSQTPDNSSDAVHHIHLADSDGTTQDLLSMALLEAVADEHLRPGASVVALYRSFDEEEVDSLSVIRLDERLERLTAADLRKLKTDVPLETLKAVVDLAVDIGREGREGHPVGTMFVVGDTRKVMKLSSPMGFDPLRGYSAKEKSLRDRHVREAIKEIAQLDGAMIIDLKGSVIAACRRIDSPAAGITLSKGLGSRHWAAAAVTKATNAIAVVVSQSSGTVRIFDNGQVVLRIEPLRRAMKWQDLPPDQPPEWLG
jgi:DNA integrity scanning protein DisA with diadenylate cyclase activity